MPADATEPVEPRPLKAMGRFRHEAVAVDPDSGIVYQTEDRDNGVIYRFIPNEKQNLQKGGRLQTLMIVDRASLDTRNWGDSPTISVGQVMAATWINVDQVESPKDDLRLRAFDKGAARFARSEGMWYGEQSIFFACTTGGKKHKGQVWRYVPSPFEGQPNEAQFPGRLELFVEPNDHELVHNADNLTVAP